MLQTILIIIAVIVAVVFHVLALVALLWWIACGESDVNGEKERDAGLIQ
jgi:uncharacterized protein YggT (Ycf19 family)